MVDPTPFELPREQLEAKLRLAEKKVAYFEKTYSPYIETKGVQNWKNLFRKPTYLDWVILFFLLMGLFMFAAYYMDINSIKAQACLICAQNPVVLNTNPVVPSYTLSNLNLSKLTLLPLKEGNMEVNAS
jgi:hypothetical protein